MTILNSFTVGSAFISIASRMVGASFRIYDAYNPRLQQTGVTPSPQVVIQREGITISLAWIFALFTSIGISSLMARFKIGKGLATFTTAIIGTTIAETVGRAFAYRNLQQNEPYQRIISKENGGSLRNKHLPFERFYASRHAET